MRLLLVDDEDVLRAVVAEGLEECGIAVVTARNAPDALALIRDGAAFDAIVVDVRMPHMSGHEMLKTLRAEGCQVPAVLMAGEPRVSNEECSRLGIGPVLLKPFTIPHLVGAIDAVIRTPR